MPINRVQKYLQAFPLILGIFINYILLYMSLLSTALANFKKFEMLGAVPDLLIPSVLLTTLALASYIVAKKLSSVNN